MQPPAPCSANAGDPEGGQGILPDLAGKCQGLQDVFFRLRSVDECCWREPCSAKRAARVLRYQTALLQGRRAHRELLLEAEQCVVQRQNAQQCAARLRALVRGGRMGGRGSERSNDGFVLVEAAVLEEAKDAANAVLRTISDAVAVAVREAEERVHSSWEDAWLKQKAALRRERARSVALRNRMRSARGLSRRAQALSGRCYRLCEPLWEARRRGESPTWELVAPLMDGVDGLDREAGALATRAQEVFATLAMSEAEEGVVAPSELSESSPEWQEWEVEASLPVVGASREERFRASRAPGELAMLRPTSVTVRLQAAVRGWIVRRRARATVEEEEGGSESDDEGYASAEEEAAEALEEGEEVAREGESELLVWSAGARCGAGWPRADARASGDG